MEPINTSKLRFISKDRHNLSKKSTECPETMLQFFYLKKNLFYHVRDYMTLFELSLWVDSTNTYIQRKNNYKSGYVKNREIAFVDFGINIGDELSYAHPCVIIEQNYDNIFVVPCSSSKLPKIYKDGVLKDGYLVGKTKDGFEKNTALILHNARWISRSRVIRNTHIKVKHPFYINLIEELEKLTFKENYRKLQIIKKSLDKKNIEIIELKNQLTDKDNQIKLHEDTINNLKATLSELKTSANSIEE